MRACVWFALDAYSACSACSACLLVCLSVCLLFCCPGFRRPSKGGALAKERGEGFTMRGEARRGERQQCVNLRVRQAKQKVKVKRKENGKKSESDGAEK